MDRHRFDTLTRLLAAAGSRREAVLTLAGGLLGLDALPHAVDPAAAKNRNRQNKKKRPQKKRRKQRHVAVEGPCGDGSGPANRCKKNRDCCTRHCDRKKGRCRCLKQGQPCTNDRLCCPGRTGRTCQDRTCQPAPAPACGDVCASGCPFSSIQEAIDDDAAGATIRLCAETYQETIAIDKNVTLLGAGDGEDGTVLDGEEDGTTVTVTSGVTVALQGLRVTGGNASRGGGIANSGDLTLTNCTVMDNTSVDGGGIFNDGTLVMTDCTVSGNMANQAGSVGSGGGIFNASGATLTGCTVSGNRAGTSGAGDGGGIANARESTLTMSGCTVSRNTAGSAGGGIANRGGEVALTGTTVTENHADGDGGGIYNDGLLGGGRSTCSGSSVSENTAGDPRMPSNCVAVTGGSCGGC